MKSSVRILAIALALAFLLLARTAFQDSPTSAKEHIDLKDGEASFADPLNGLNEASYLGFGDAATKTVYFYVESKDLNTQITARRTATTSLTNVFTSAGQVVRIVGGTQAPYATPATSSDAVSAVSAQVYHRGADGVLVAAGQVGLEAAIDNAYCLKQSTVRVPIDTSNTRTNATPAGPDGTGLNFDPNGRKADGAITALTADAYIDVSIPAGWALYATGVAPADVVDCPVDTDTVNYLDPGDAGFATTSASDRSASSTIVALVAIKEAQRLANIENDKIWEYKSGNTWVGAAKTAPARRFTSDTVVDSALTAPTVGATQKVGGADKPLLAGQAGVSAKRITTDTTGTPQPADNTDLFTVVQDAEGTGQPGPSFSVLSPADMAAGNGISLQVHYDIVDVYAASDDTKPNADHPAYVSGYGRAYVSSGSDSGQWVTISEVAATVNNTDGTASPTSNLFQGSVVITNDTDHENDSTIYAQDGDSLTVQVFDENGNRSSDVLATATATIDDSPPTISDLSPADEAIINDDALRISFNVNDDGAGSDFRKIENVVEMVQVQARTATGDEPRGDKGTECLLASGAGQIDNAGGNASRVGVLVAPSGQKFTSGGCGTVVDVGNGGKFNLIITAKDLAGNVTKHTTQLTIDKAKPTVMGNPSVGQAWDDAKNKAKSGANSILIQFSESLDPDTVAAADFTVKGYTVDAAEVVGVNKKGGAQNLNKFVVLTLTEDLANDARPSVTVEDVDDVAGNTIEKATRTSDNKIKAAITVVPFAALIAEDEQQAISFTSDEALRSKSGANSTKGSANGDSLTVKVADDTMGGNATFKQSAFEKSGAYGVMLQAVDIDGNVTRVGAVSVDDDDVKLALKNDVGATSTFDVKLANWPPADSDLDGSLKGEILAMVNDDKVASSTGVFDSKAGTVELMALGTAIDKDATLTLSYSYVTADQVIQVDVDKPTMVSIPADNKDTDYASGAIQFIWTEDKEYAGDSYKTVTLNEASHKGPDGESMDILDQLTTNNNKRWVYRPDGDLALGAHEFTLKATDAAGNSATVSTTITVIERKPVEVSLSPGWNLISFRGAPASLDVNDVFSDDTVTVISQYDGRRVSPWTVWTRGSDGSLKSSPAGRMNIDPGLGFYVLSTDGSSLMVDIPGTSQDSPAEVPPSIELIAGWNLIAVIIIDSKATSVVVDDYLPAGTWTRAFKRDNATGVFSSISPLPEDSTDEGVSVNAGQALWVYATKAGTVVPK